MDVEGGEGGEEGGGGGWRGRGGGKWIEKRSHDHVAAAKLRGRERKSLAEEQKDDEQEENSEQEGECVSLHV